MIARLSKSSSVWFRRLSAKRSVYSSGDLRKYEYLTGEDLGYKPSVFEQAKFDYSPLGNIFTVGLDEDNQKERLFKRLENIKDKVRLVRLRVILIMTLATLFTGLTETLKKLKECH